jgi:hypothetical protein
MSDAECRSGKLSANIGKPLRDWTMAAFRAQAIERVRKQVGRGRVLCGLSGELWREMA